MTNGAHKTDTSPWPLTVVKTRYQGVYERGGKWAAFNLEPQEVSSAAFGDDCACEEWWAMAGECVGTGGTPDEAIADMVARIANWDGELAGSPDA